MKSRCKFSSWRPRAVPTSTQTDADSDDVIGVVVAESLSLSSCSMGFYPWVIGGGGVNAVSAFRFSPLSPSLSLSSLSPLSPSDTFPCLVSSFLLLLLAAAACVCVCVRSLSPTSC